MPKAVRQAMREEAGSVLAFLPGAREIHRTAEALAGLGPDVIVAPLFGALSAAEQDAAVSPAPGAASAGGVATDLAESALTIEGVRIVVDSGLSRVAEDEAGGLGTRLDRARVARLGDQRRGRAGRTAGRLLPAVGQAATRGLMSRAGSGNPVVRSFRPPVLAAGRMG